MKFKILIFIFILFSISFVLADSPWWNSSWDYNKKITITESSNKNISNYPIIIENFNCSSNCLSNGEDIRVVSNNGTEIALGIKKNSADNFNLTFKVNLNASEALNYSIYYGNNSNVNAANISWNIVRWNIWDDFSDNECTDWTFTGGTHDCSSGYMSLSSNGTRATAYIDTISFQNVTTTVDIIRTSGTSWVAPTTFRYSNSSSFYNIILHESLGYLWQTPSSSGWTSYSINLDASHTYTSKINGSDICIYNDGSTISCISNSNIPGSGYTGFEQTTTAGNTFRADNYGARYWTYPEPISLILHEETVGNTCTYTSGNWEIDCNDNCSISSVTNLGGNNMTFINSGYFNILNNITGIDNFILSNSCKIAIYNGGRLIL